MWMRKGGIGCGSGLGLGGGGGERRSLGMTSLTVGISRLACLHGYPHDVSTVVSTAISPQSPGSRWRILAPQSASGVSQSPVTCGCVRVFRSVPRLCHAETVERCSNVGARANHGLINDWESVRFGLGEGKSEMQDLMQWHPGPVCL